MPIISDTTLQNSLGIIDTTGILERFDVTGFGDVKSFPSFVDGHMILDLGSA